MPGLTGLEVAGRLHDAGYQAPVAIFSACLDPVLKEAGASVGARVFDKLNWKGLVEYCRSVDDRRIEADAPAHREFQVARAGALGPHA